MILITEFMDEEAIDFLRSKYEVVYDKELANKQQDIPNKMKGIKALIVRNRTKVSKNLLEKSPNLSCVGRLGVGLDNIDLTACRDKDINVYPATGANTNSVVEYVLTTALVLLRGAFNKNHQMISGAWPREESSGNEISGKTLGLVGFGEIAQKTSILAKSFNMKIIAYDPFIEETSNLWNGVTKVSLDELLRSSDVVSIHTPLNENTHHLINSDNLKLLKQSSVIINAARGGVVDDKALAKLLRGNKIKGAALDVFETEPMDQSSGDYFKGLDNVILTPHIGGVTYEANQQVSSMIARKVDEHLSNL